MTGCCASSWAVYKQMAQIPSAQTAGGWKRFLREVKVELTKVEWPNRQELIAYTAVVFVTVAVITTLLWSIDALFNVAFRWLMKA